MVVELLSKRNEWMITQCLIPYLFPFQQGFDHFHEGSGIDQVVIFISLIFKMNNPQRRRYWTCIFRQFKWQLKYYSKTLFPMRTSFIPMFLFDPYSPCPVLVVALVFVVRFIFLCLKSLWIFWLYSLCLRHSRISFQIKIIDKI